LSFFLSIVCLPPLSTLFPYTTLFRSYFSPGYTYQQYTHPYWKDTGTYDAAGPGAGCYPGSPPTCSQAIDPGALPGVAIYPAGPQPSWPNAAKPYEYWLMWPAPAHNAGLNAIYYDPRL